MPSLPSSGLKIATQCTQQPPSTLGLSRAPPRVHRKRARHSPGDQLRCGQGQMPWHRPSSGDGHSRYPMRPSSRRRAWRTKGRAAGDWSGRAVGERRPLPRREEPVLMRTGGKIYGCDWMRVACPLVRDLPSGQDAIQRCCRRSIWARAPHMRDGLFELSGCTHAPAALWHLRTCLGNVLLHIYPRDSLQRQYKGCML